MKRGRKSAGAKARVLIVEDHPIVSQGIATLISGTDDFEVCGEARTSADALERVRTERPDVVTLDLRLHGCSGMELLGQIRAVDEDIKVLVTSVRDERLYAERCIRAGASGYVGKDKTPEVLLDALRQVVRGKIYVSEAVSDRLLQQVSGGAVDSASEPAVNRLSDRELQVFERLGEGLTTRQIADELHLSVKTIETYRESIKDKLGLESSNELLRYAVQWELET